MKTSRVESLGYVILQPGSEKPCPVDAIQEDLGAALLTDFERIVIQGHFATLSKELTNQNLSQTLPPYIIYICHGSHDKTSFDSVAGLKNADWFDANVNVKFVIAHSCFSAQILSQTSWKDKFQNWVASNDAVWYSGDIVSRSIWGFFFSLLCSDVQTITSGADMVAAVKRAYIKALELSGHSGTSAYWYLTCAKHNSRVLTHKN